MFINCHTCFSLRYGIMSVKQLLQEAQSKNVKCLALTDINNTSACLEFIRISKQYEIKPVIGIDFRNGVTQKYIGIAKSNEGFYELNAHLSLEIFFPIRAPNFNHAYIIYPFGSITPDYLRDNEFIGIKPSQLIQFRLHDKSEGYTNKLVILQPVSFRNKTDFNAHRLLRAIDNNTLLSKLPKVEEGLPTEILSTEDKLKATFKEYPEIINNTQQLLDNCNIHFEFGADQPHKNQATYTNDKKLDYRLMKKLCYDGLKYRYDKIDQNITDRLNKELKTIHQKDFTSYFLISWKIVKYARSKGYFYVGRGSGANSIVAYLLRITDVDPIELDLYFERFINLFRKNPPDFDIDFSWTDREDVTKFIFQRFQHVALLATYNTFQFRSTIREIGKVFGLPPHEIKSLQGNSNAVKDKIHALVLKYSSLIHKLPSYLSIHAGGILISEKPIHYYTATYIPPKGFPTVHFDMITAEDIGLHKWDILGQRGLGKIKDALSIIKKNHPKTPEIDIHNIKKFTEDPKVKHLLRNAEAIGCFYVESPAMRMLLKKLQVDNYLGLVAASSVIRPGVAQSGMMRQYILRHRYPEKRKDAHPVLQEIMPETYGVMVYQEDVIKVAHHFAGLPLAEADVLRRGMSGKYRSREEFQLVKQKFFDNCTSKGYSHNLTADVWRQIESFAGYAFAKGHSASYAVESYQSLYLKSYFPLEYMVAVLNNGGGFYSPEFYLHEARTLGATVEAPCINRSNSLVSIQDKVIHLGFSFVKQLELTTTQKIIYDRNLNGLYQSMREFVERVSISLEQLRLLIRIGAFRFTEISKKELLWDAHFLLGGTGKSKPKIDLFKTEIRKISIPPLYYHDQEDAFEEIEILGFSLSSPFTLLKDPISDKSIKTVNMPNRVNELVSIIGYLVHVKNTNTAKGDRMQFGTFVDLDGRFIDTVHFSITASRYPFRGPGCYSITGKVVEEFEFCSIEVIEMKRLPYIEDPRYRQVSMAKRIISNT
ncbi:DNA polymerase III subunit alpha [Sphingobacteriaceae bacterium AH-315-L07]|nr:DNA polymerase III subunit alpha [Sphingobacteriaceae bacterium AH-315-L07]